PFLTLLAPRHVREPGWPGGGARLQDGPRLTGAAPYPIWNSGPGQRPPSGTASVICIQITRTTTRVAPRRRVLPAGRAAPVDPDGPPARGPNPPECDPVHRQRGGFGES